MQKINTNASILVWSIFLSLIISLWFISISTNIHKTIQDNIDFQNNIINTLSSSWTSIYVNETATQEDKHNYTLGMKKEYTTQVSFSGSSQDIIQIDILNWWPIELIYNNDSTIIQQSYSFSGASNNTSMILNNISWYSLVNIYSSAEIIKPNNATIIWKKIWNQNLIKQYPQ